MNAYEMRIDRLSFNTKENYSNIQTFSVGHESCVIKFFKIIQHPALLEFLKLQKNAGKQIRIITPFVPEQHLDKMKDVIKKTCDAEYFKNSIIIVNDFGLMNYIHKIDAERQMCLGRSLIAGFDYAPWGHRIYENESQQIQKVVSQVNFYDDEKMSFFKQFNVTEIEADFTEGTTESLKEIQKAGFKVNLHRSSFLYGIQRSCYIKRYRADQTCSGMECEYAESLELDKLWCGAGYYQMTEDVNFPSPLYLRGNQIFGKTYDIPCDWADGIVVSSE